MNKTLKTALCLVLVVGTLLCLCACGGSASPSPTQTTVLKQSATGRYEIASIEWANGTVASGELLEDQLDTVGDMYVELFSDGSAQLCLFGNIRDTEFDDSSMWTVDAPKVTYTFSVKNGKVTLEEGGDTYIFVKD